MDKLSTSQVQEFVELGYVKIENAFSTEIAVQCCNILWKAIGLDPGKPEAWANPVIRIGDIGLEPFKAATNTNILLHAFGQLAGDNWLPRNSLGTFPIRFPSKVSAGDTGWHVDASFPGNDNDDLFQWRININSKGRALLMLFLFSDVAENDAPTVIRESSHFDVAKLLEPHGENGLSFLQLAQQLPTLPKRKEVLATGKAGTVYLCHPFIVHSAQGHRGSNPKFMAQPPLLTKKDFDINKPMDNSCPVERAIKIGLAM